LKKVGDFFEIGVGKPYKIRAENSEKLSKDKGGKEDAHYVPNQSYQRLEQLWIPDQ